MLATTALATANPRPKRAPIVQLQASLPPPAALPSLPPLPPTRAAKPAPPPPVPPPLPPAQAAAPAVSQLAVDRDQLLLSLANDALSQLKRVRSASGDDGKMAAPREREISRRTVLGYSAFLQRVGVTDVPQSRVEPPALPPRLVLLTRPVKLVLQQKRLSDNSTINRIGQQEKEQEGGERADDSVNSVVQKRKPASWNDLPMSQVEEDEDDDQENKPSVAEGHQLSSTDTPNCKTPTTCSFRKNKRFRQMHHQEETCPTPATAQAARCLLNLMR